ncbi:hypothetical protein E4U19_008032 [Claviceps sp. Clav32 group G5]|nr:hypothetical protein E4U19_008032 [Claviceps sp. Clav32 group G5]
MLSLPCDCGISIGLGLPCRHRLLQYQEQDIPIPLGAVDRFWWLDRKRLLTGDDLPLGPYDPLIVKGKGRPKGSPGLGSRSHRRDPTLLDRALDIERNEALQNSSSAPSSSAPPALQPAPSLRNRRRRLPHPEFAFPDAPNSPSTTTNASATIKALEWLDIHGDTYEAGTQMPRASQRMAPPLEDPVAPFSLGGLGDIIFGDGEGLAIEVEDDVTNEAENEADIAAHIDAEGDDVATREYWDGVMQEHVEVN